VLLLGVKFDLEEAWKSQMCLLGEEPSGGGDSVCGKSGARSHQGL
jgi:hypothetical protein